MTWVATAVIGGALVGAGASIYGGKKAGDAADRASSRATDAELQMYRQSRRDLAPWRESGEGALGILNQIYGIKTPGNGAPRSYAPDELLLNQNGVPMVNAELYASDPVYRQAWDETLKTEQTTRPGWNGQTTYSMRATDADWTRLQQTMASNIAKAQAAQPQTADSTPVDRTGGFTTSPGYQFRVNEDTRAIERSAASRGRLFSGGTRDAIGERASARASEEWNNFLAGLRAQAGLGQAATSQGANLATQTGGTLANIYQNQGAQRASSYQNMASGVNSAIQGGLGNWVFYDMMRNPPKPRAVG